ncbi:hypothetical protein ACIA8K_17470 [Catenuloplanes sp. NPDC051500]|uniref:hypothetical protein n=1 Tax=Catenuloplanes sp. NPDC051500 TaxID=3363959 RepID=UPI0037A219C1
MGRRRDEQDSGLGVVYGSLDTQVLRRKRRSAGRRAGMVAAVLLTAALIAAPALVYAGMLPDAPLEGAVVPAAIEAPSSETPPPTGPITVGELRNVSLARVPDGWTCPAGGFTVTEKPSIGDVWATSITHGDVDGDGAEDAVVVLRCVLKESAGPEAAVAFTRLGADVVPIGVITVTTGSTVQWLSAVDVRPGGPITITVGDLQPYADQLPEWTRRLDAEFLYAGAGEFAGGLPSFSPLENPQSRARTDLWVRSGNLTFDEEGEGTVTVTVANRGPVIADDVWLSLDPGGPLSARGQGWNECLEVRTSPPWAVPPESGRSVPWTTPSGATPSPLPSMPPLSAAPVQCRIGDLEAGEELRLLLVVHRSGGGAAEGSAVVYRRALGGAPVPDLNPADDQAALAVQ